MTDEHHDPRPLTAQARYVAAILAGLTAEDVAMLVAAPPGNRAKEMTCLKINAMVREYAPTLVEQWTELLIAAAAVKREPGWSSTWNTQIAEMLEINVDGPSRETVAPVRRAARAAESNGHSVAAAA